MKRRIFGLENEYGLTCTLNGERRLSPDNVARYLFEKVIPGARHANVFLENGARLYLDTGFHPEYATPECDDVAELVIHDKAGERLVDLQYHDIRPEKGVYYRLALNDQVDRITDDETIEQAKHVPPQTTRARLRGEFIRQADLKGKDYRVDWVFMKLNDPERETILCKDPFQSHDERIERLIRSF